MITSVIYKLLLIINDEELAVFRFYRTAAIRQPFYERPFIDRRAFVTFNRWNLLQQIVIIYLNNNLLEVGIRTDGLNMPGLNDSFRFMASILHCVQIIYTDHLQIDSPDAIEYKHTKTCDGSSWNNSF